jgi:hypothetical protein
LVLAPGGQILTLFLCRKEEAEFPYFTVLHFSVQPMLFSLSDCGVSASSNVLFSFLFSVKCEVVENCVKVAAFTN